MPDLAPKIRRRFPCFADSPEEPCKKEGTYRHINGSHLCQMHHRRFDIHGHFESPFQREDEPGEIVTPPDGVGKYIMGSVYKIGAHGLVFRKDPGRDEWVRFRNMTPEMYELGKVV